MGCRRSVRRFFRLYSAFLSRPSSMALMPGAEPAALSASEQRLGVSLPAELWELYRHRSGQAPGGGPFVTFADDMRLLGLDEVVLERHPGLPELRQRLALLGRTHRGERPRPGEGEGEGEGEGRGDSSAGGGSGGGSRAPGGQQLCAGRETGGERSADRAPTGILLQALHGAAHASGPAGPAAGAAAAAAAAATVAGSGSGTGGGGDMGTASGGDASGDNDGDDDDRVLVVASNPSASRRLLVALDGRVYLARGLSITLFASGVAAMIQKLLQ
ncbi:hypothetical protein PLESTM_001427500 [Pleodorina starrii]|nr:hypothetical protein PLESTM_001427500 [Pleodorina starrii]